jgi:hypothetical protein
MLKQQNSQDASGFTTAHGFSTHLRVGDHAENRRDYRTARAYGIDPNYL